MICQNCKKETEDGAEIKNIFYCRECFLPEIGKALENYMNKGCKSKDCKYDVTIFAQNKDK